MENSERINELRLVQIEAAINVLASALQLREPIADLLQDTRDKLAANGKPAPAEAFVLLGMLRSAQAPAEEPPESVA